MVIILNQLLFSGKRSEYRGSEDFQPGLIDPQAEEKAAKRKANILKAIGAVVVAAGAYVFLRKPVWVKIYYKN